MNLWNLLTGRQMTPEPPSQINRFGGIAQERVFVGVQPQVPPDQPRQGVETPCRPARWPIAILTGIDPQAVAEGRFVAGVLDAPAPHAAYPLTRQTPDRARANIPVPAHIAYGTLFTSYSGAPS